MKLGYRRVTAVFVAGLLAALPLVATAFVCVWAARLVLAWLGPASAFGSVLRGIGFGVTSSELAAYAIGISVVVVGVFVLGLLVEAGLQRGLAAALTGLVGRIPVVRNVYDTVSQLVGLLARRDSGPLASMSPVWCHFGGPGGAAVLALLGSPEPVEIGGRRYRGVIVPTAPVPIGGALLYVPEDWIAPAEIGIDGLTSIYVSMGVTADQYLGGRRRPRT